MKPTTDARSTSSGHAAPLLVFGAHPDDIEFGCGGVVALATQSGQSAHLVVCSRGESATNGTPRQRTAEAKRGAACLEASIDFLGLGGDAHFEVRVAHVLKLAAIIRRVRPGIVLAPSPVENQHPDHAVLGKMVRDAARLARYGGVKELRRQAAHAIGALHFYAVGGEGELAQEKPVYVDVSAPTVMTAWQRAMEAHATQARTRDYVKLQLARAAHHGARCGVAAAIPLYPSDPLVLDSLASLTRTARRF